MFLLSWRSFAHSQHSGRHSQTSNLITASVTHFVFTLVPPENMFALSSVHLIDLCSTFMMSVV